MFSSIMMTSNSSIEAYASFENPPWYTMDSPPSQKPAVSTSSPSIPSQATCPSGVYNQPTVSQSQQRLVSSHHDRPLEVPWNSIQPQHAYECNVPGANMSTSPLYDRSTSGHIPMEYDEFNSAATASEIVSSTEYQCWQHGCNGRSFTHLSNYRRHLKEKTRTYVKAICPTCRRQFSRVSARDNHYNLRRCKVTLLDDNLVPYRIRHEDLYQSQLNEDSNQQ